ncbi:hypothetical protein O181_059169 [Austropuccinia psidii MF-1]|uniref:Tc1-like transposase DDE domain-containing protein n=1 Tax=Austropuccinia psidii MF-1 TaxID=1389203 RepID=A0A9Q3EDW4_9BASI|nr:hypothetical protein [Austropuccinia psidii MF-1]
MPPFTLQCGVNSGVNEMDWPPHSPDLNPIETIWKMIKSQINNLYQPQTMDKLRVAIQAAWDGIAPDVFNKHLLLMAHCMQMVIDMNGGPTSY